MQTPDQIAAKFSGIDAHDDMVEGFSFRPALSKRRKAKVEVVLFREWEGRRRLISFNDCANFEVVIDADILVDNAPRNTCALQATSDASEIETLIRRHKRSWNVSYQKSMDPLPPKLSAAGVHVLFRIRLFGGQLLVLARSFAIKHLANSPSV
jgi:hypothetical protein